jgi:UDP-N-acetyl-D-mannosaminuronic acid dehydrogenase
MMKKFDCVIIGIGRVGLPLGLSMASKGISVIGLDLNEELIKQVNQKIFPFKEEGYEELIKKVDFHATTDYSVIESCERIIITVGTPLMGHIETDLSFIIQVLDKISDHLNKGHHIILRSTIAPNTTKFVRDYIEQKFDWKAGQDFYISYCPERMAEGKSLKELDTLPQIIGNEDEESRKRSVDFFNRFVPEILETDFISAELVKLFNNISRYIYFSTANQFAIISEQYGADVHNIIQMSNYKYPRGVIPRPGFTAGTCLRKDFGMINESIPFTDLLLSAWKVNEFMPKFLVDGVCKRMQLKGKKIAVLGYTFKQDVDDVRDSLVPKLIRYLRRENPKQIVVNEPNLGDLIENELINTSLDECIVDADVVILAINHAEYVENYHEIVEKVKPGTVFADLWNLGKNKGVFYKK